MERQQRNRIVGSQEARAGKFVLCGFLRRASVRILPDFTARPTKRCTEWRPRFCNVSFTARGDARILFTRPATPVHEDGPYLPVEAFEDRDGDFVLYMPELLRA